jgi:hypothetical protein
VLPIVKVVELKGSLIALRRSSQHPPVSYRGVHLSFWGFIDTALHLGYNERIRSDGRNYPHIAEVISWHML